MVQAAGQSISSESSLHRTTDHLAGFRNRFRVHLNGSLALLTLQIIELGVLGNRQSAG